MISMTFTGPLSVKLLQVLFCKSCFFYKREPPKPDAFDSEQFRSAPSSLRTALAAGWSCGGQQPRGP